jgi:hypothetical protein
MTRLTRAVRSTAAVARRTAVAVGAALIGALALSATEPVHAHHAFAAEFTVDKPVSLRGIVTKVELINPHSWIHIEVDDDAGARTSWAIEGGSPNALFKKGVTKNSIPVGSELVVGGYQARDGSLKAVARTITFADGRPLFFIGTELPDAVAQ